MVETDHRIRGFRASGVAAGIKPDNKKDLGLITSDGPIAVAGVFTKNKIQAAPVELTRQRVASGQCRALVVNSGIANCCSGEQGVQDAIDPARLTAEHLDIDPEEVLVASTGVIGLRLPMGTIENALPQLVSSAQPEGFNDFARAIMTTDTVPKVVTRTGRLHDHSYAVTGVAKGAGMIHPDMATMLAFVFTDLSVKTEALQTILNNGVDQSFNRISIDGDTSTNDMVLLMASGRSNAAVLAKKDRDIVQQSIHEVMIVLAKELVKDGEGATKLVTIAVVGAESTASARAVANTVATSPLVKTALFGEDANWGRIVAAVGRPGILFRPKRLRVLFDDYVVFAEGMGLDGIISSQIDSVLKKPEYTITIDLGMGSAQTSVYTCDLSVEYVHINADYRT